MGHPFHSFSAVFPASDPNDQTLVQFGGHLQGNTHSGFKVREFALLAVDDNPGVLCDGDLFCRHLGIDDVNADGTLLGVNGFNQTSHLRPQCRDFKGRLIFDYGKLHRDLHIGFQVIKSGLLAINGYLGVFRNLVYGLNGLVFRFVKATLVNVTVFLGMSMD